mmetsp:Transcript_37267/g.111325  ORF Transcript_37267/g.111325 Transcript_37267/m.111325 type:complete len:219 (-) Transcript_37267:18-674(-)
MPWLEQPVRLWRGRCAGRSALPGSRPCGAPSRRPGRAPLPQADLWWELHWRKRECWLASARRPTPAWETLRSAGPWRPPPPRRRSVLPALPWTETPARGGRLHTRTTSGSPWTCKMSAACRAWRSGGRRPVQKATHCRVALTELLGSTLPQASRVGKAGWSPSCLPGARPAGCASSAGGGPRASASASGSSGCAARVGGSPGPEALRRACAFQGVRRV